MTTNGFKRESPKLHVAHDVNRQRALSRYRAESRKKKESLLMKVRQCNDSSDRREVIRAWLTDSGSAGNHADDFNWEAYMNTPEYADMVLEIESQILHELEAEEGAHYNFNEDMVLDEENGDMPSGCDEDPRESLLCPVCWQGKMHLDDYVNCLFCPCGAAVFLRDSNVEALRMRLCGILDRHALHCSTRMATDGGLPGAGIKFYTWNGCLIGSCAACQFEEHVA